MPLLRASDAVGDAPKADGSPWFFVGTPDDIGGCDNHGIGATNSVVRDRDSLGAPVSALTVGRRSAEMTDAHDSGQTFHLWAIVESGQSMLMDANGFAAAGSEAAFA